MSVKGYDPSPGPQNPSKYPTKVGPNYQKYGEQPGWIYNPYTDHYVADPKVQGQYNTDSGITPKSPGLGATLLPIGAAAGTIALAQGLGKEVPGMVGDAVKGVGDTIKGAFNLGGSAPSPVATIAQQSPVLANTAGSAAQQIIPVNTNVSIPGDFSLGGNNAISGFNMGGDVPAGLTNEGGFSGVNAGTAELANQPSFLANSNLGMLGQAAGAYGLYDTFSNNRTGFGGAAEAGLSAYELTAPLGPEVSIPAAAIAALVAGTGLFAHETTKENEAKHTKQLLGQSPDDPAWVNYVNGMRNQTPNAGGAFANGQYQTWDQYKQAGLNAKDLSGVYGNMQTFGPDWAKYSQAQREAITQGLINADLYDSKKGEVVITDQAKAKDIAGQVMGGQAPVAQNASIGPSASQVFSAAVPALPPSPPAIANLNGGQANPTGNFGLGSNPQLANQVQTIKKPAAGQFNPGFNQL